MQKMKSIKLSGILNILKCCLLGVVVTLVGIVILALVLKFTDLNSFVVGYLNDIVKAISLFVVIICLKRISEEKLLLKSIIAGCVYTLISFIIFSVLNGSFVINLSLIYDLLFAVIVSVLISIILNVLKRKTI